MKGLPLQILTDRSLDGMIRRTYAQAQTATGKEQALLIRKMGAMFTEWHNRQVREKNNGQA